MSTEWLDVFQNGGLLKKTVVFAAKADSEPERLDMGHRVHVRYRAKVLPSGNVQGPPPASFEATEGAGVSLLPNKDNGNNPDEVKGMILGHNDVLPGLDMGVALMVVGETALFKIAPKYAYGEQGW